MVHEAISADNLTFAFPSNPLPVLRGIDLHLPQGSRCLLIGANGAGKSTLLQIFAGKRLIEGSTARVMDQEVFFNTPGGVTYLGTEWANNPVVRSDLVVSHFIDSVGGWRHKERRDRLLDILDVDLEWHMHTISDGERRRVQIVAGLMAPWNLLLLDEVTVDLDVLVRTRLLAFLKEETIERKATVLYATHIFDGLDNFPSHVCHLQLGSTLDPPTYDWPLDLSKSLPGIPEGTVEKMKDVERAGSRLMELALAWLIVDTDMRKSYENEGKEGFRKRGRDTSETKDMKTFYQQYDYAH